MPNIDNINKIYIASDHAGFDLKQHLIVELKKNNHNINIIDLGCNSDSSVDYPDFARKMAIITRKDPEFTANNIAKENFSSYGILICGSGIGINIAANRFSHLRAALCSNQKSAKLARQHNNANIICLGSRMININNAFGIVAKFLSTRFKADRHLVRINKINNINFD